MPNQRVGMVNSPNYAGTDGPNFVASDHYRDAVTEQLLQPGANTYGISLSDLLTARMQYFPISQLTFRAYYLDTIENAGVVDSISTAQPSAGANGAFVLDPTNTGSYGQSGSMSAFQQYDVIQFLDDDFFGIQATITNVDTTTANAHVISYSVAKATDDLTTLAADAVFIKVGNNHPYGSGTPDYEHFDPHSFSYNLGIYKRSIGGDGAAMIQQLYYAISQSQETGNNDTLYALRSFLTKYKISSEIDRQLLLAQEFTNTTADANTPTYSGIWEQVRDHNGMIHAWDPNIGLQYSNFSQIARQAVTQKAGNHFLMLWGFDLYQAFQRMAREKVTVFENLGAFHGNPRQVELNKSTNLFSGIEIDGIKFECAQFGILNDPDAFGNTAGNFPQMGYAFPHRTYDNPAFQPHRANSDEMQFVPAIAVRYAKYGNVDRRMAFGTEKGLTGWMAGNGWGNSPVVSSGIDEDKTTVLCHHGPQVMMPQHHLIVCPAGSYL